MNGTPAHFFVPHFIIVFFKVNIPNFSKMQSKILSDKKNKINAEARRTAIVSSQSIRVKTLPSPSICYSD